MSGAQRIIGADPGLSGALALYVPALDKLTVEDMPVLSLAKGKGTKNYIDYGGLARLLDFWCGGDESPIAFVELVGSRPGEGAVGAFDFGRSFGALIQALHCQFIRVDKVTPAAWKRTVGLPAGATKDDSRALASNLFPQHAALFARKKDDGRAEASLIARHGAIKIAAARL